MAPLKSPPKRGAQNINHQIGRNEPPTVRDGQRSLLSIGAGVGSTALSKLAPQSRSALRALAFFPLVANDALVGNYITYYDARHAFSDAELALAISIARQLGFSLRAEKALGKTQRQLESELAANRQLQKISTQLIHASDVEVLYEKILDAAVAIMRSDFASMQMFYPQRGELRLLAHRCNWCLILAAPTQKTPPASRWLRVIDRSCRTSTKRFHGGL